MESVGLVRAWLLTPWPGSAATFGDVRLVVAAALLAEYAHRGQKRKYTGEPYIVHPLEVAGMVAGAEGTIDQIAAAILHDTLEDTTLSGELISAALNPEILHLVWEVTDTSRPEDGNRAVRKAKDRDKLAGASPDAQTIKLADLISNSESIVARDPKFAAVYMQEKRELLKVLTHGDKGLHARASALVDDYFASEAARV